MNINSASFNPFSDLPLVQSRAAVASTLPALSAQSTQKGDASPDNGKDVNRADAQSSKQAISDKISFSQSPDSPSTYDNLQQISKKQGAESEKVKEQEKQDQEKIKELKDRDQEVRIHEQAHAAVGGQYAGAPRYEFETGPDGNRYAVGGEVSIDVSEEKEPKDTISKMQVVRAAALAPAEPSAQDYKVAAEAAQKEQKARAEANQQALSNESDDKSNTAVAQSSVSQQALQSYQMFERPVSAAFSAQA